MEFLYFLLGLSFGLLVVGWIYVRFGKSHVRIPHTSPTCLKSIPAFQPWVKALMTRGNDRSEIFFRSIQPRFLVRVRKRAYKRQPTVLVVEIRSSDDNRDRFEAARQASAQLNVEMKERLTPKLRLPKDIRLRFEAGTFAPSAVTTALGEIFEAVGAQISHGVHASDRHPAFWLDRD
jgi:hypothetical protein